MSEQCKDKLCPSQGCGDTMSIHTQKITDSCRDKDCIEDLRVYLTAGSQSLLDCASTARVRSAELLHTRIRVEPVAFDRNHYCIHVTFYYRVLADVTVGTGHPATVYGLALFSKRAVLCGEDSRAHVYRSDLPFSPEAGPGCPAAVVEVLDPMVLDSKMKDVCECGCSAGSCPHIDPEIFKLFDEELVLSGEKRRLYVTLGQFSVIRLERDAQLVVPVVDYSMPSRECCDFPGSAEDPCEMFSKIPFPENQFSPRGCDSPRKEHSGYETCGKSRS